MSLFLLSCAVYKETRTAKLRSHVSQLKGDRLLLADRLAELDTLFRVVQCVLESALCDAKSLSRDTDTPAVQSSHRDLEAVAFLAKKVLLWNFNIVEDQLRSAGRADAHLVIMIAELEAFPAFLYDKGGDAACSDIRCSNSKDNICISLRCVGDKDLAAVQQIIVSFQNGRRLSPACIGTCIWLSQAECADLLAAGQRSQVLLLLFLGTEPEDRIRAERYMCGKDNARAPVYSRQLLYSDGIA